MVWAQIPLVLIGYILPSYEALIVGNWQQHRIFGASFTVINAWPLLEFDLVFVVAMVDPICNVLFKMLLLNDFRLLLDAFMNILQKKARDS